MFPLLPAFGILYGVSLIFRGEQGRSFARAYTNLPRRVKLTYYHIATTESGNVPIVSRSGVLLARVSEDSYKNMVMEGTGILPDGRLVNFSGESYTDPTYGNLYKWILVKSALGVAGKTLVPFKSIAVDPNVFPIGSVIFVPELGQQFSADDVGSLIKGDHIDLFIGSAKNLSRVSNLPSEVTAVLV